MLVTVASFHDPTEAQVVCALLDSAGIAASVADLNLVIANPQVSLAIGGVRVQVPASDADEARALVAAYHAGELASDEEDVDVATPSCPACLETRASTVVPLDQKVLALAVFLLTAAPISTRAERVCAACGRPWAVAV